MLLGLYFLYPLSIQKEKVCFLLLLPTSLPPSLPPSVLPFLSPSSLKEMVWKDSLCWFFFFWLYLAKNFCPLRMLVLRQISFLWHYLQSLFFFLSSDSPKIHSMKWQQKNSKNFLALEGLQHAVSATCTIKNEVWREGCWLARKDERELWKAAMNKLSVAWGSRRHGFR